MELLNDCVTFSPISIHLRERRTGLLIAMMDTGRRVLRQRVREEEKKWLTLYRRALCASCLHFSNIILLHPSTHT